MPDAETIRAALRCDRATCACQRPRGQVHCPVSSHGGDGDQHPSLSVNVRRDGRVLLKCWGGCEQEAVIAALRARGLWPERRHQAAERILRYEVRDGDGALVAVHVRRDRDGVKTFEWRRPDGSPGLDGLQVADLPLYGINLLRDRPGEPVIVCEGEKATQALLDAGRLAVGTVTGASGTPSAGVLRRLADRQVYLWPDSDAPGQEHMRRIAARLQQFGVTPRLMQWRDGLPGGDAADFVALHGAGEALDALLAEARPAVAGQATAAANGLDFVRLGDLLARPEEEVRWVVQNRLPTAGLSLLAGKPKAGKSTLARCLALAVARGEPWLGFDTAQGSVLYLALGEEKVGEVRRHFEDMGAGASEPVFIFCSRAPQDALDLLRREAEQRRPALIIVDPLLKLVRVRDGNDYAEVTRALEPLLALARETGAHVLAVHHLGKGDRVGGDAILGSTAIFAAPDTALLLKRADRYRTLSTIQRYGDDLPEVTLVFDQATRWITVGPPREEVDEVAAGQAILDYLAGLEGQVEEPSIHEAVEGRKSLKERALRRLVRDGRVIRAGQGRRGDPYRYALSSVSGFLPPSIYREGAEGETENGGNPHSDAPNSPSRDSAESDSPSRDPEGSAEADSSSLPLFAQKAVEVFGATVLSVTPAPKEDA